MRKPKEAPSTAVQQDRVVAGSALDFMEVRHLVLEGTNEEIGRALASIARDRYGVRPVASSDRLRTRAQRRYFETNCPILADRMRGVAAEYGKRFDDDDWNVSVLEYLLGPPSGCSVVYYPRHLTADGSGVVSRNYDFGTGTAEDTRPRPGELPVNSRPYLIEMHPTGGYASLALCAFDLLSGVLDGINSEGLTVAILVDDEFGPDFPLDPPADDSAGLDECQTLRMLLDTCASVEQAKEALLQCKQYYRFVPSHFLVADQHGQAFVWEYSPAHNREFIIENPGKPLISTNFRLHQHLTGLNPPSARKARRICERYSGLAEGIGGEREGLTLEFIKRNHKSADATLSAASLGLQTPIRTLWHALYFPERRKLQVSFYLGKGPKRKQIKRSDYLEFFLPEANSTSRRATNAS